MHLRPCHISWAILFFIYIVFLIIFKFIYNRKKRKIGGNEKTTGPDKFFRMIKKDEFKPILLHNFIEKIGQSKKEQNLWDKKEKKEINAFEYKEKALDIIHKFFDKVKISNPEFKKEPFASFIWRLNKYLSREPDILDNIANIKY